MNRIFLQTDNGMDLRSHEAVRQGRSSHDLYFAAMTNQGFAILRSFFLFSLTDGVGVEIAFGRVLNEAWNPDTIGWMATCAC